MNIDPRAVSAVLFFVFCAAPASADTIRFKNGHTIEGLVLSEDDREVQVDLGQGKARFKKSTIRRIEKSDEAETQLVLESFERKRAATEAFEEERLQKKEAKANEPEAVKVQVRGDQIFVKALLNEKEEVTFVLDTGATDILLTRTLAKKLGIRIDKKKAVLIQVADGRKVKAVPIKLKSVEVQGMKAKNVDGHVLLKTPKDTGFRDGLLGMSYLGRFTFKVDKKNSLLTLEKNK